MVRLTLRRLYLGVPNNTDQEGTVHQVAAPWAPLTLEEGRGTAGSRVLAQLLTCSLKRLPCFVAGAAFPGAFLRKCKAHPSGDCLWLPVSRLYPPTSLEGQEDSPAPLWAASPKLAAAQL